MADSATIIECVKPPADLVPEPDPVLITVDKPSDLVKVSDKSPAAAKVSDERNHLLLSVLKFRKNRLLLILFLLKL